MKHPIRRLRTIGMISGTSFDGIDVAVVDVHVGTDEVELAIIGSDTYDYPPELVDQIAAALPPAATSMEEVCKLDTRIGQAFAAAAVRANGEMAGGAAELIGSHGQTMFHWVHDGTAMGSLQLGQPAWITEATGLPVVADLRAADVAAGGHGAPLASTFDVMLLRGRSGGPRASLNLGGISNVTLVDDPEPIAYDIGPANALVDIATGWASGGTEFFDADGARARAGHVDAELLARLLDEPFYDLDPPKSTGKELFNAAYLRAALDAVGPVDPDDVVATTTHHAAKVVADDLGRRGIREVVAAGGGTANPVLMGWLAEELGSATRVTTMEDYGVPNGAKEAVFFAMFAALTACGHAATVPSCTGATAERGLGVIVPAPTTPITTHDIPFHRPRPPHLVIT
ncbi:anhydro-N-acetylmuramic acid kinase [Candidatus Poriferisocius sp.]|uniref:anhydro-N-acetylmuramic acid kinase n=1 Tax=Candidatus Poriferisocius sp. TaxID=3101276 RepID=UPI003B594F6B